MFIGQHDKCVWQVTPPEETHDFGFHIAIWCLKVQQNSLISSELMIHKSSTSHPQRTVDTDEYVGR
jgi:hypothetical protein